MTVTFFSNFLNDHQLPFCQAMINEIGADNFRFVAFRKIDPERAAMGFADLNEIYPFVVKAYNEGSCLKEAYNLMLSSDVVIIGSEKGMPVESRIKEGKLTFRYNERLLKRGDWLLLDPRIQMSIYKRFGQFRAAKLPFYVLCASAYTARDLNLCSFPKSKCLKWGYFPTVKEYKDVEILIENKESNPSISILWAGRFIEWKHPEIPIKIAKRLKADNIPFHLDMIGIGEMHDAIKDLVTKEGLSDCVSLLGSMPPAEVRAHMESSNIYLFTSDRREGWGAVLNESMNSACVVIADDRIGSVPFMLQDGLNGYTYHKGNIEELYSKLLLVVKDKELRHCIGLEAYHSMTEIWNAKVAVNRLLEFINNYREGCISLKEYGPCTKCE